MTKVQTKVKETNNPYFKMDFLEFTEMICRVAIKDHEIRILRDVSASEDETRKPIEKIVFDFLDVKLFKAFNVFPLDT